MKLNEATEHFETQNVSLTVPFKSDNPIVRVPKKFELSGSLGKFARLGYLGTSGAGSCEVNVTTCSDGEPVRSLALTENILYLKGGRDDIKLCIHMYCVGNNLIKTTHFILELDREEEPLLGDEAVDFCADNDTFHVSMTRSQDGGDCDQWCSSLESEEECSGACHAITGKYSMSVCCFKSDEWSIHYLLSFIVQGRLVTGGLVRVRSPTPPSPQSRP